MPFPSGLASPTFLNLADTPNTFAAQANKTVTVKADESGLEFTSPASGGVDHATLSHLTYATAAHTGFEPTVTKGDLTETTSAILTITGGTGAVIGAGATVAVQQADATHAGYLSDTDWNTFDGKQDALATGNLTAGSTKITIGGTGTGAVIGAGVTIDVNQANLDHGSIDGRSDDDHTQYALLAGRAGNQALIGGTAASGTLTLQSTSDATKGDLLFGASAYKEATDRLGIGTTTPRQKIDSLATTTQLRLSYADNAKFADFTVNTTHDLTITPSSTGQVIVQPTTNSTDFFQVLDADGGTPILNVDSTNERVGIKTNAPTAALHLAAGSATAGTAPLKLTSGTLLSVAEAGAVEFLTDTYYGTITTGAARKEFVLNNTAGEFIKTGAMTVGYRAITALRTLDATDYVVDCTANTFDVTLPAIAGLTGRVYIIKNSGTGVITIKPTPTDAATIDGKATYTLSIQYGALTVIADGTNWKVI